MSKLRRQIDKAIHALPGIAQRAGRQNLLRNIERGDGDSFEFTVTAMPILMLIGMIAFATIVRTSQMPAWDAAFNCARLATSSRSISLGESQGQEAALRSLNSNFVKVKNARIDVQQVPDAGQVGAVRCTVSYDIDVEGIFLMGPITGGKVPMTASVLLDRQRFQSDWNGQSTP